MVEQDNDEQDSLNKKKFNEERIRVWREKRQASAEHASIERRKKADIERDIRVERSKRQRQDEIDSIEREKKELALQKLPSLEKINEKRQSIVLENHRKKHMFFKKIGILLLISALFTAIISCFTTPFYEAESIVTIKTNATNNNTPTSSIIPTSVNPNIMQYIFSAREYIFSRDMMNRMEQGKGYLSYFKKNNMHALSKPFSNTLMGVDDYQYYKRRVKVAVDIQEGLLKIKVQAKNPEDAKRFADALLHYAELWVNSLSNRMFADKIKDAEDTLTQRKKTLQIARKRIVNFQISKRDLNPRETIAAIYKQLHDIKTKMGHTEREIAVYKRAHVINSPVVERLKADLSALNQQQKSLNVGLIDQGDMSMNRVLSGFESALILKDVSEKEWEVALNSLEKIKSEVFNQRQYFLTIVPPISSSLPAEPQLLRVFLLLFIILYFFVTLLSLLKTSLKITVKA
jgi:BexC/CtrB/KpsE family polysaccharide export inner-membrane protein